ncbi:hypothetical protein BpHYR1_052133 [Brachionus plicatilis]|uniref:Uncharacterized protein n=1 Tax=Brachionus plicatilis TaxID=10195 RepID=A0A3M7RR11_BRAPC|nr:hypothetical protein BpHYR1_052133 [Brachionus plicatilis]
MAYYPNRLIQLNTSPNSVRPIIVSGAHQPIVSQPVYQVSQPYATQNSSLGYYQNSEESKPQKPKAIIEEDYDYQSDYAEPISPLPYADTSRKLLVGFHNHYDRETEIQSLQCCTCCIGCWRKCCSCCSGCENFISCPIYCWILFIMPVFLILIIGAIVSTLYATQIIK